jgi:hypothetical protein
MTGWGARSRSHSAGRRSWSTGSPEWDQQRLVAALASQCLGSLQPPAGRAWRKEEIEASTKGFQAMGHYRKQPDGKENWICTCGYPVWARKEACPRCQGPKLTPGRENAGPASRPGAGLQETRRPAQREEAPQEEGTGEKAEGDTQAELTRKRQLLSFIAVKIEGWPTSIRSSQSLAILHQEAEDLKAALGEERPTVGQLLGAKEDVNSARRKIMRAEGKRDKANLELSAAKKVVAKAHLAHDAAEAQLEAAQRAQEAPVSPSKSDFTKEDWSILKRIRSMAAGNAGPPGGKPYLQALAEVIPGHDRGPMRTPGRAEGDPFSAGQNGKEGEPQPPGNPQRGGRREEDDPQGKPSEGAGSDPAKCKPREMTQRRTHNWEVMADLTGSPAEGGSLRSSSGAQEKAQLRQAEGSHPAPEAERSQRSQQRISPGNRSRSPPQALAPVPEEDGEQAV